MKWYKLTYQGQSMYQYITCTMYIYIYNEESMLAILSNLNSNLFQTALSKSEPTYSRSVVITQQ